MYSVNEPRIIRSPYLPSGTGSTTSTGSESDVPVSELDEEEEDLPYPGFVSLALKYLDQTTRPRNWCLRMITNPWFERVSMMVILLNCVTLGMYQPCIDEVCNTNRCKILQIFDDFIFAFFALEMAVKIIAMGIYGKRTYLADAWNWLDLFIVLAGALEYCLDMENMNLSAIRTVRVLRPLRAINRIPSMRILVMLLLDTLPMLGNVLLLCFFVFFIFGIVGVQLWEGILRQRCVLAKLDNISYPTPLASYYNYQEQDRDYICTTPDDSGMHTCNNLPLYLDGTTECNATAIPNSNITRISNVSCVNWNQYYNECRPLGTNPFQGAISFDNIGLAWVAIFLVISLEGWTDIMYYVQDAHSFWDWIYFVLLIVIGSFFMINLCLVVIATQFSETKKREMERMRMERARFQSTSTLASTNNSEPNSCYAEIMKYVAHLCRRAKRKIVKRYRLYKYRNKKDAPAQSISLRRKRRQIAKGPRPPEPLPRLQIGVEESLSGSPHAPRASPEISDVDPVASPRRPGLLRVPSINNGWEGSCDVQGTLLSPNLPQNQRRRSSVMFSDVVLLHGDGGATTSEARNVCSSEKMTQTGDGIIGNVWRTDFPVVQPPMETEYAPGLEPGQMTCQELLALSGAISAALPTQLVLDSRSVQTFFSSLSKGDQLHVSAPVLAVDPDEYSNSEMDDSDYEMELLDEPEREPGLCRICLRKFRGAIKSLVQHKYFQMSILCAILVNTSSMACEYHDQPEWLTVTVERSNIVFSAIFGVEMFLKIIAEGPFGYISNGFNVFDGVIVVLSVVELWQTFLGEREGSSGLSVLRTFRLLRILKLVRFMPNLRRQLFVMLRTMDNVAVFFALLVLFIFIFSILGMYLFGGKFCMYDDGITARNCSCEEIIGLHPNCTCDRKHFNNILWATVTVFQILTQEDWNVVLFNGMEKTSHWAALYFVALMTFGNYVLFNLLVAILVEGFSAERNERMERELRERQKQQEKEKLEFIQSMQEFSQAEGRTDSGSDSDSGIGGAQQDSKKKSTSSLGNAEDIRKMKDNEARERENGLKQLHMMIDYEPKCNIQKECKMLGQPGVMKPDLPPMPPIITHTAATPQDSPNTTLEPCMRDFNNRLSPAMALYASTMSIDSIDRSSSSQCSIPGLLKPPTNKLNNLSQPGVYPRGSFSNHPRELERKDSISVSTNTTSTPKMQRRCSWKLGRPSLKKKSKSRDRCYSGSEEEGEEIVLNNGLNNNNINPMNNDHSHCNGGLLGTIRNDTSSNKCYQHHHHVIGNNRTISPQNSIRSNSSTSRTPIFSSYSQVPWVTTTAQPGAFLDTINRHNSICSHKTLTPQNSLPPYEATLQHSAFLPPSHRNSLAGICREKSNNLTIESPLPPVKVQDNAETNPQNIKKIFMFFEPKGCLKERVDYSLYIFPPENPFRQFCEWFVTQRWFDNVILLFIGLNCITLAMERPNIPPESTERLFLSTANYLFTFVFAIEMLVKVIAAGMLYGKEAYFTSGWNIMDGSLVIISIIDLLMSIISESSPRIFGILRVFRLLRSLRPLRVINRAPGLKLVVQTLLSSLRPIGNIVIICCTFFLIFGILGVQLFKGTFYYCEGHTSPTVKNKTDCKSNSGKWVNRKYNFDNLPKALMSLFVLSSKDGWVNIMYTGLDAVGVDQQPIENYSEWRLLYFISFLLLVGFFVLNMFVGVVVENFHRCREEQEKEEKARRALKRAKQMEKKRGKMHEPPYWINYSKPRLQVHNVVTSKYFDLAIAAVIGLNVVTMAMEFYKMPDALTYTLKIFNYFFTAVFILELGMKLFALGWHLYLKDRWNQLDVIIVILSIVGIVLEEVESKIIPINPTIIRVMRVLRIARVLKLLKMAKGIRALLDTVMQALPQVGNLGLLFFLLFFIFAALGVELFGRLDCIESPCEGLGEHAHFANFGMAFLTLFRVATGDNWNGIMKDTLRYELCSDKPDCFKNCCTNLYIAPVYFVIFVLMAQFVLVNVVVAVLMKHLEESNKQMEDELDMEVELERELAAAQEELEMENEEEAIRQENIAAKLDFDAKEKEHKPLNKVLSLPANFTFSSFDKDAENEEKDSPAIQLHDLCLGPAIQNENMYQDTGPEAAHIVVTEASDMEDPPPGPPAYPATGYTVYNEPRIKKLNQVRLRRIGSDPNMLLPLPKKLLTPLSLSDLSRDISSPSDISGLSPECISPTVIMVPPPYPATFHSPQTSPDEMQLPQLPAREICLVVPESYQDAARPTTSADVHTDQSDVITVEPNAEGSHALDCTSEIFLHVPTQSVDSELAWKSKKHLNGMRCNCVDDHGQANVSEAAAQNVCDEQEVLLKRSNKMQHIGALECDINSEEDSQEELLLSEDKRHMC